MATVSEAIGLALPYSAGAPAPYDMRDQFCMTAGEMVMDLVRTQIRPRDIVTIKALENAATVVAASGGSTNAALHLPAIAHEAGIEFTLDDVCDIFRDTPYFVDLKPGGRYVAKDLYEVGEIPPLGHVPKNMYAWVIRKERHGEPITAMQQEVVPTAQIGDDECLVMVMAGGVNYNGVWAALGIPLSPLDVHKQPTHIADVGQRRCMRGDTPATILLSQLERSAEFEQGVSAHHDAYEGAVRLEDVVDLCEHAGEVVDPVQG